MIVNWKNKFHRLNLYYLIGFSVFLLYLADMVFLWGNYPKETFLKKENIERMLTTLTGEQRKKLENKLRVAKMKIIATQNKEKQKELLAQFEYI